MNKITTQITPREQQILKLIRLNDQDDSNFSSLRLLKLIGLKKCFSQKTVNYFFQKKNHNSFNGVGILKEKCAIFITRQLTTKKNGRPVRNGRITKSKKLRADERRTKNLIQKTLFYKKNKNRINYFDKNMLRSLYYLEKKIGFKLVKQFRDINTNAFGKIRKKLLNNPYCIDNLMFYFFYGKNRACDLDNAVQLFMDELEKAIQHEGKKQGTKAKEYDDVNIIQNYQDRYDLPRPKTDYKSPSIFMFVIEF